MSTSSQVAVMVAGQVGVLVQSSVVFAVVLMEKLLVEVVGLSWVCHWVAMSEKKAVKQSAV